MPLTQEEEEHEEEGTEAEPQHAPPSLEAPPPAAQEGQAAAPTAVAALRSAAATARAVLPVLSAPETPLDPAVRETRTKLLAIRVKLLRLAARLGQTVRNSVVAQVLYRLDLAEKLKAGAAGSAGGFGPERAAAMAEQAEAAAPDSDLGFTCTILLLGKSGVGKSATVNSLLGACNVATSAFESETKEARLTGQEALVNSPTTLVGPLGRGDRAGHSTAAHRHARFALFGIRYALQQHDHGAPLLLCQPCQSAHSPAGEGEGVHEALPARHCAVL